MTAAEADWDKISLRSSATSAKLERNVAAIDAANPKYLILIALIVATLCMVSCGLLVASDFSNSRGYLYAFTFGISAILSLAGTLFSFREALQSSRRADFYKRELQRHLKDAEMLAGFGFARVDKLAKTAEEPEAVEALRRLQDAIRESRLRLGMK
jgi:hypothetical protein